MMEQQTQAAQPKTKDQLRQEILQKRDSLSESERDVKSTIIAMQFFASEAFKNAKTIFAYASYGSEVSTNYLMRKALLLEKKVCIPKVNLKTGKMWPVKINSLNVLKPNKAGIPEAGLFSFKVDPMKVDVILVPAAVFDLHGHRIGSGKGFYDRYLSTYQNHAKIIGLAFDFQIVNDIPEEPHDVKVHKIITEKRIINCS
ncbi:TPA: 5-formyltetrahydrofolate cyclo-ligase [archaeon]|uniref:5-formyltetrahydrofolate cyclo-ligase n=1 Tax=Candidatus Naiadarchaeum limnaeum TaxID=2756139 RepID=A0A832V307_9ARCH|nr:5-formyltetrahydrofolate cyclo-ligase [Candidatus Naiadarchaeum limnaeum]